MEKISNIPSISELALRYGTINENQFSHITSLISIKEKEGIAASHQDMLLSQKMATEYQLGLLQLIYDYLIVKAKGEEFGKIAIQKGVATKEDIQNALEIQKKEFKRARLKILIGDILVDSGVITVKQRDAVLREQRLLENYSNKILSSDSEEKEDLKKKKGLSKYEKQFLEVQVLDKEFAAMVVEKNYASVNAVKKAQSTQEDEFSKNMSISRLGDILVRNETITNDEKDLILKEQDKKKPTLTENDDHGISIEISPDNIQALVFIKKSDNTGLTIKNLKSVLQKKGVLHGLFTDPILQCFIENSKEKFTAAKQDFSLEFIKDLKAKYFFNTEKIDDQIKKKGETLAQQMLTKESYLRKDLFGNSIKDKKGLPFAFKCGSGTRFSNDNQKVFASKTGYPSLSIEKKLSIHPNISVLEDADLKYGPLETYANLSISGILTGAYPVKAGNINANEIRGASIEAIGDISSSIGITDASIRTQGNIYAKYIHNSTIITFGDVVVDGEILDSNIACSGRITAEKGRVINSELSAKKGIIVQGIGSDRTEPCTIRTGCEYHIFKESEIIDEKINKIRKVVNLLEEKVDAQKRLSQSLFQKMVELKIFYDKAKLKKEKLENEFKDKLQGLEKSKQKNIIKLVKNFNERMKSTKESLLDLNKKKKNAGGNQKKFELKIEKLMPSIKKAVEDLEADRFAYFEWSRKQQNIAEVKVFGKIFQGTFFKGIFSSFTSDKDLNQIIIREQSSDSNIKNQMVIKKIN